MRAPFVSNIAVLLRIRAVGLTTLRVLGDIAIARKAPLTRVFGLRRRLPNVFTKWVKSHH
jgi:hypothetical protein